MSTTNKKKSTSRAKSTEDKKQEVPAGEPTPVTTQASSSLESPAGRTSVPSGLSDEEVKEQAKAKEGRTSDAATRTEGTNLEEVKSDISESAKPTDGGADVYPFPPQGDVDIATVNSKPQKGEKLPPLPVGAWVRLGDHELVPDRLKGHIAYVVTSPTQLCNCDYAPVTHEHQSETAGITVKTRDEVGATLTLPKEAFSEVSLDGRHGVAAHG
jgi:hypothetical protein